MKKNNSKGTKKFKKAMKKHYRKVLKSANEYEQCLNPVFPKNLLPNQISWMSLSTLNPLSHVKLNSGQKVLDIGCGAGADCFLAAEFVGTNGEIIGIDPVEELIEKARSLKEKYKYKNIKFKVDYGENISFQNSYFDLIIMNYSFHLIKGKKKFLSKIYKILKKEGKMVVADSFEPLKSSFEKDPENWFYKAGGSITPEKMKLISKNIGFINIKFKKEVSNESKELIGYMILEK